MQVAEVLSERLAPTAKPFVLALQEVWTRAGFEAYTRAAKSKGFYVSPTRYEDIKDNGQLMITNQPVIEDRFVAFLKDSNAKRGLRILDIKSATGHVQVMNVHTSYSGSKTYSSVHLEQLTQLAEFLNDQLRQKKGPMIVTGDFNLGGDLSYINQTYDPAEVLWKTWVQPMFKARHFKEAPVPGITWDRANRLVSNPTTVIKDANIVAHGKPEWEENSSTLDHVFVSNQIGITRTRVTLDEPKRLSAVCAGRSDADGRTLLSDHYAVTTELEVR